MGEPFIRGREFRDRGPSELLRDFGERFADTLERARLESWTPVSSSYGEHLVYVVARRSTVRRADPAQAARRSARQRTHIAEVALIKELRDTLTITREPWSPETP